MLQFQFHNNQLVRSISLPPLQFLLSMQQRYWQHHKNISASINYLICKYFLIDSSFQEAKIEDCLVLVDKFFRKQQAKMGSYRTKAIQWFNSLLFNVAAINQDYQQSLSLSLLNSSKQTPNQQQSISLIESLQQTQKQNFTKLLNLPSLLYALTSINPVCSQPNNISHLQYQKQHQMQFTLMSTIQYLCSKMEIKMQYQGQIENKLDLMRQCECGCQRGVKGLEQQYRVRVNRVLFGEDGNFRGKRLEELIKNNCNADLWSVASLIDANYKRQQAIRPIFSGTTQSGIELIQSIVPKMLLISKNSLFSQQMLSTHQIFQIFMSLLEFRHLNIYASWLKILQEHLTNLNYNHKRKNKKGDQEFVKSVINFIYMLIAEYDDFVQLMRIISHELTNTGKYSKIVVLQLLKKLVLNRFLLNPKLFYDYAMVNVDQQLISVEFNKIRLLFYPKKCQNPQLLVHSEKLESAFSSLVFSSDHKSVSVNSSKCVIYRLDYSLKSDYETIYSDLVEKQLNQNQSHRTPVMSNSSYSLSFSFVKSPKQVKTVPQKSRRKNQQTVKKLMSPQVNVPSENCSINTILNKINGNENYQEKSNYDLGSPTSQKSKKTVLTQHTQAPLHIDPQMAMLQELVNRRRMLGAVRRAIDQRRVKKTQQRIKLNNFLSKVHYDFTTWIRQVQSEANRIRLEIQLI